MAESRQDELYDALQLKGYPEDFCREIAYRQMNYMMPCSLRDIQKIFAGKLHTGR